MALISPISLADKVSKAPKASVKAGMALQLQMLRLGIPKRLKEDFPGAL